MTSGAPSLEREHLLRGEHFGRRGPRGKHDGVDAVDGEVTDRFVRLDDVGAVHGGSRDVEGEAFVEGGYLAIFQIGGGDGAVDDVVGEDVGEGLEAEDFFLGQLEVLADLRERRVGGREDGQGLVAGERAGELSLLDRRAEDGEVVAEERSLGGDGRRGGDLAAQGGAAAAGRRLGEGGDAGGGAGHRPRRGYLSTCASKGVNGAASMDRLQDKQIVGAQRASLVFHQSEKRSRCVRRSVMIRNYEIYYFCIESII